MPAYDYRCPIGHQVELFMSIDEMEATRNTQRCPTCGRTMTKLMGVPMPLYTNDQFLRGMRDDGFGTDDRGRKVAKARAERAGVSTAGKIFCPSLCPRGDSFSPKAWVSDRDDVKRICQRNGWGLHGAGMELPDPEVDTTPQKPFVADDLVHEEAERVAEEKYAGDVTPREFVQLKEKVRETVTPKEAISGVTSLADLL